MGKGQVRVGDSARGSSLPLTLGQKLFKGNKLLGRKRDKIHWFVLDVISGNRVLFLTSSLLLRIDVFFPECITDLELSGMKTHE